MCFSRAYLNHYKCPVLQKQLEQQHLPDIYRFLRCSPNFVIEKYKHLCSTSLCIYVGSPPQVLLTSVDTAELSYHSAAREQPLGSDMVL